MDTNCRTRPGVLHERGAEFQDRVFPRTQDRNLSSDDGYQKPFAFSDLLFRHSHSGRARMKAGM
jgi:hypothetical protein